MTLTGKVAAMLEAIGAADLERMAPAERQQLSNACERVNLLVMAAERSARKSKSKAGVLARLDDGERAP